jgi:hypothetical protein
MSKKLNSKLNELIKKRNEIEKQIKQIEESQKVYDELNENNKNEHTLRCYLNKMSTNKLRDIIVLLMKENRIYETEVVESDDENNEILPNRVIP